MISIWPFSSPASANYDYMKKQGWFVDQFKFAKPPYHKDAMAVYDATSPGRASSTGIRSIKDCSASDWTPGGWTRPKPETEGQEDNIQLGPTTGRRQRRSLRQSVSHALLLCGYGGQRSASDKKRVYILSRSALPGRRESGLRHGPEKLIPTGSVTAGRFRRD